MGTSWVRGATVRHQGDSIELGGRSVGCSESRRRPPSEFHVLRVDTLLGGVIYAHSKPLLVVPYRKATGEEIPMTNRFGGIADVSSDTRRSHDECTAELQAPDGRARLSGEYRRLPADPLLAYAFDRPRLANDLQESPATSGAFGSRRER
jgi:hypothetical protein